MAKIHTLTYNGTKSSDLGVFVSGSGSFDAAEFDVDKYEIPGRNGDLILSNNRYKNIEITYPAFIPKAFMDKVQNVRNWLRSSKVYARLEDTYDMDHYRLGIPTGVQSFSPENRNDGANFEMTFDCKPQRFLKVGETPETVEADVQTESGEIVTFETVAESPITSASVSLSPIQSLNGYDSPWPAGGGKNKLPMSATQTVNGITFTANSDGTVTANGTASNTADYYFCGTAGVYEQLNISSGLYYLSGSPSGGGTCVIFIVKEGGQILVQQHDNAQERVTLDATAKYRIFARVFNGVTVNNVTLKPMLRASGTDETFSPYSNICPISGHTGAELNIAKHNIWDEEWTNGSIAVETGAVIGGYNVISRNYISVVPNTEYYATQRIRVFFYDANKTFLSFVDIDHRSFTTPSECRYILLTAFQVYGTTYNNDISINYPATDTEYHAYDGDTYSVTFTDQGTVYGGTYDFVSGKLKATWASLTLNGTERWSGTPNSGWYTQVNSLVKLPSASEYADAMLSDRFPVGIVTNGYLFGYVDPQNEYPGQNWIYYKNTDFTTPSQVSAYFADNPTQVVYKLATPLEYTLSPQQLTTLLGQNVVWGNGPITLTYAEPYNIDNPTLFDARPLFTVTNPAEGDVIMVNGQAITFVDGYAGTVYIDCETMNAFSGAANLNSIIQATDFPVLVPGTNIVTWTGAGECTMTPRWWEL